MANILVIEDEAEVLLSLRVYNLKHEGYQTHAFLTGEEGLDRASQEGPPNPALLDVMLPGISGIEAGSRLQTHARTRKTRLRKKRGLTGSALETLRGMGSRVRAFSQDPLP